MQPFIFHIQYMWHVVMSQHHVAWLMWLLNTVTRGSAANVSTRTGKFCRLTVTSGKTIFTVISGGEQDPLTNQDSSCLIFKKTPIALLWEFHLVHPQLMCSLQCWCGSCWVRFLMWCLKAPPANFHNSATALRSDYATKAGRYSVPSLTSRLLNTCL